MTLTIGDRAPELTLTHLDGQQVRLSQAWSTGRPALLVCLRHLG